jgi:hypothetical protein
MGEGLLLTVQTLTNKFKGGGVESMSRVRMGTVGGAMAMDPQTAFEVNFVPRGIGLNIRIEHCERITVYDIQSEYGSCGIARKKFGSVHGHANEEGVALVLEVATAAAGLNFGEFACDHRDKKVAVTTCRLEESGSDALGFSRHEVKHRFDYGCRSEHFPAVGDALVGLDQFHKDHSREYGCLSSLNRPYGQGIEGFPE